MSDEQTYTELLQRFGVLLHELRAEVITRAYESSSDARG